MSNPQNHPVNDAEFHFCHACDTTTLHEVVRTDRKHLYCVRCQVPT